MKRTAQFIKLGATNYPKKKTKKLKNSFFVLDEEEVLKDWKTKERMKWDAIWASKPYGKQGK